MAHSNSHLCPRVTVKAQCTCSREEVLCGHVKKAHNHCRRSSSEDVNGINKVNDGSHTTEKDQRRGDGSFGDRHSV